MIVNPRDILPSQDFLKPSTITYIFSCIENNELDKLPPAPIVRKDDEGNLIAIDGHNLIAVMHALGQDIEVHIANSKNDGLVVKDVKYEDRNEDLLEKYDHVIGLREETLLNGINTFRDLLDKHRELFYEK